MCALTLDNQTTIVRPIVAADAPLLLRLLEDAWRVHVRIAWGSLKRRIRSMRGVLAEDRAGVRGFMLIEAQPPQTALIIAAGLRDTWGVQPYLKLLLPELERVAIVNNLVALACVGYENWLVDNLQEFGFATQEWILTFERAGNGPLPTASAETARVRSAHRNDLSSLLTLDVLAFDNFWRKSAGYFSEALAHAGSFTVAELAGQIVGYEWCEIYHQHAHLTRLAVHPGYQGRGIGSQLLRRAISDVLATGVNLITLNTQETNYRSQALYLRFGFHSTKQRIPVLWKKIET